MATQTNRKAGFGALDALDNLGDFSKAELIENLRVAGFKPTADVTRDLILEWIVLRTPQWKTGLRYKSGRPQIVWRVNRKPAEYANSINSKLRDMSLMIQGKTRRMAARKPARFASEADIAVFTGPLGLFATRTAAHGAFLVALERRFPIKHRELQPTTRYSQHPMSVFMGRGSIVWL
jgi:hypothetical protein